jgi:hypothetical protein
MADLYTLICEYRSGTYIAQMSATSPRVAILSWLSTRSAQKYIPKETRSRLKIDLEQNPPVYA